jgi:hypothetical protein
VYDNDDDVDGKHEQYDGVDTNEVLVRRMLVAVLLILSLDLDTAVGNSLMEELMAEALEDRASVLVTN